MKYPLIVIYLLPLVLTILLGGIAVQIWQAQLRDEMHYNQAELVNRGSALMSRELGHITQIMEYMHGELEAGLLPSSFADEAAWRLAVAQYFVRASRLSNYVSQIRWLAPDGQELVRVNVDGQSVEQVPSAELQNKANRYYFTEGMASSNHTVVLTPIDLNVENGNIVRPYEVTMRASSKLRDSQQQTIGLLVVNYNLNYLFARLRSLQTTNNTLEIINTKGQWLLASQPELEWLHLYGDILSSFANQYPYGWQQVDQSLSLRPISLDDGRPLSSIAVYVDEGASQAPYYYFISQVRPDIWRQKLFFVVLAVIVMVAVSYTLLTAFGLLIWRNIEQRKKNLKRMASEKAALEATQEKLTEANKMLISLQDELVEKGRLSSLGLMVAGVSHELNTPLGGIRLCLSSLQHIQSSIEAQVDPKIADAYESATRLALQNLNRAADVIEQFKRITQQKQQSSDSETFNVRSMIEDTLSPLKPALDKRPEIHVSVSVEPGQELNSSSGVLSQVLQNLVLNALDHAFSDGRSGGIWITAKQEDEFIIEISDNGAGIPAPMLESIWEPFVTTGRGKKHSGLGLYMVHQWVTRLLGGRIEARSDEQGTRFTIFIPNQ